MRILYFILFFTLKYAFFLFFRRVKTVNSTNKFFGRTIYVSNHPASFMDPLVVAGFQLPIVFFMTRSDVFTKLSRPFLWACHMLPIYRQQDGVDTKGKNDKVFKKCSQILLHGRNLLIFGEGFTDDVFIRRLKSVKKGALKIGFSTLEKMDWKKNVYIVGVGCNYTQPNRTRGDLLISNSERICLNDYKGAYETNPTKVIAELTEKLELMIRAQITDVRDKNDAPFHENIMKITRKGMNIDSYDSSLSLEARWKYSRKLALWLNEINIDENKELSDLKSDSESYFKLLKRMRLEDKFVYWKKQNPSGGRLKELILMILTFPIMVLGMFHCFLPYIIVKRFTEKTFRRDVFWSSVKLVMGKILIGIMNIPYIFVFYYFIYPSGGFAILYYLLIGIAGLIAYIWFEKLKSFKTKGIVRKTDLTMIIDKRDDLEARIKSAVPAELA